MTLWIVIAALLLCTVAALLYPLLRPSRGQAPRFAYDVAVYRSQLAEVEQEADRGFVSTDLADAARTEIQRRLLAADRAEAKPLFDSRAMRLTAAVAIGLMLPLGSLLLYAAIGAPGLPGQPYAERLKHDPAVIAAVALDKDAARLRADPSAKGYLDLGNRYAEQHDYVHAAESFQHAISLGSEDSNTWSDLGEAIVLGSNGAVVPEALRAFAHALTLNRFEPRARFYVGLAEAEIGHYRQAVAIWRDLEKDSLFNAPWLPLLERQIASASQQGGFDPKTVAPMPPSPEALQSASQAMAGAGQ